MRLIDVDRLVQKLEEIYDTINPRLLGGKSVRKLILNIINYGKDEHYKIDPESLKEHARWEISLDGYYPYCSKCNEEPKNGVMSNYCPNCGAKMDLERGEA